MKFRSPNSGRKSPKESRGSTGSASSGRKGSTSSEKGVATAATVMPQAVWGGKKVFSASVGTDNRRFYDIVIVGGGIAAGYAASEFVKQDVRSGKVLIISAESIPPYERGPYCWKLLQTNTAPKDTFTCTGEKGSNQNAVWYAVNGIDLLLDTFVTEFHGGDRTVMCSNNMLYTAKRALIIATGSMPKQLPIAPNAFGDGTVPFDQPLKGLYYFSNQKNTLALATSLHAEKPSEVVIVGAGFLGLQLASHLAHRGIKVKVICKHGHVMPYLFPETVAAAVEKALEAHGVTFIHSNKAADARGKDGVLTAIRLADGTDVPASCAVVAIGSRSRSTVFSELHIKDDHIVVDHYFRTNCPGVYAIGDVCAFPLVDTNSRIHQHAVDARRSGTHCARIVLKDIEANPDMPSPVQYTQPDGTVLTAQMVKVEAQEMFMSADLEDAFEPSSHLVSLKGPCELDITFIGETIGDEIVSITDAENPSNVLSVWVRDWRVLGVLIGKGAITQVKVLQLAVKHQVLVDVRKLKQSTTVDDAVEVICEKLYLVATSSNTGQTVA